MLSVQRGVAHYEEVAPPPFIERDHSISLHYHHYHHYNRDLPLETPRARCGNVTRCDPISVVDIHPSPSLHTSTAALQHVHRQCAGVGGEVLGQGRDPSPTQSDAI